jgi:putative methionine-R-sulfoxide reductase with GAF domain
MKRTQHVCNVNAFPGHIACGSASASEIVVMHAVVRREEPVRIHQVLRRIGVSAMGSPK